MEYALDFVDFLWTPFDLVLVRPLEDLLMNVSHDTIEWYTDRSSSVKASWYLHPKQHAVEFLVKNTLFLYGMWFFYRKAMAENQRRIRDFLKRRHAVEQQPQQQGRSLWTSQRFQKFSEAFLADCLLISFAGMLFQKASRNATPFLLQPCHVHALLYWALLTFGRTTSASLSFALQVLFNMIVPQCWGAYVLMCVCVALKSTAVICRIIAMLQPDFRDYTRPMLDIPLFWLEHGVLVLVPLYLIASHRYMLVPLSFPMTMLAALSVSFYHSFVLTTFSYLSGLNLNYMMVPPLGIAEELGRAYRVVMYFFGFLATFFTRYVLLWLAEKVLDWMRPSLAQQHAKTKLSYRVSKFLKTK